MSKFRRRFGLLAAIMDAFFAPSETVDYPFGDLELPKGFRGALMIDPAKCSGCGLCARDCPAKGLALIKQSREEYRLIHYPARCAYCGQCEDSCVRGAISHSNQVVPPVTDPRGTVVVLHEKSEG